MNQSPHVMKKVRVEDLADSPKEDKSNPKKVRAKPHPLLIPLTHADRLQSLTDQGYDVIYDPPGDGNCQFSALAFVLPYANIYRSAQTLRNDVIKYLREHDRLPDGYPMELFMDMSWNQYINEMSTDGTYGDEITLRAVSNIYNVEIDIVSTLGQQGFARILPENSEPIFRITLGHFAEGQGFHYIALNGNNRAEESMIDLESADEEVRCDSSNNQNEIDLNDLVNETDLF